jgi:hypothetical protein
MKDRNPPGTVPNRWNHLPFKRPKGLNSAPSRLCWLMPIVGSFLTSKALMMGQMRDYPISLLLIHVVMLLVGETIALSYGPRKLATQSPLQPGQRVSAIRFLSMTSMMCASLVCAYKTLRFAGSLPTAVLLLTLYLRLGDVTGNCWREGLSFSAALRWLAFLCGFAFILIWDFRLNITSRDMSLVGLLLFNVQSLLSTVTNKLQVFSRFPRFLEPCFWPIRATYWPALALLLLGALVYLDEGTKTSLTAPTVQTAMLLAVNIAFTSCSYLLWRPEFYDCLLSANVVYLSPHQQIRGGQDMWLLLAFTGFVSLGSWFVPGSPVLLSIWQFVGFIVALMVSNVVDSPGLGVQITDQDVGMDDQLDLLEHNSSSLVDGGGKHPDHTIHPPPWYHERAHKGVVLCAIATWLIFSYTLPTQPTEIDYAAVELDRAFVPSADLDIVVAAYERPGAQISNDLNTLLNTLTLRDVKTRVFIYDKGNDTVSLKQDIRETISDGTEIIVANLENEGREGATYLHHIVSHWDELARHTLFIQEQAHDFVLLTQRLADYLVEETGFMSLSYEGKLWKQCEYLHANLWPGTTRAVSLVLDKVRSDEVCRDLVLTYRGQFVVSGARIRGHEKALYVELLHGLLDVGSWMHSPKYTHSIWTGSASDSLADPAFGYTLERLWGIIMQCSDDNVAYRSPSLLGSYVRSVWFGQTLPVEDVQCLDNAVN